MVATNRIAMRDVRSDTTRRWYAGIGIGFTSLRRKNVLTEISCRGKWLLEGIIIGKGTEGGRRRKAVRSGQ
jgi:hypothetical protein